MKLSVSILVALALTGCGERAPSPETSSAPVPTASEAPAGSGFSDEDLAAHAEALRRRAPAGFTVLVERPFVVVGDEAPEAVRRRAIGTVRFAVTRLKRDFFERDPQQIIDIWLFRDEVSYRAHALELFGDRPDTPFGYYSAEDRAMVMNIRTGGGTLVHEIVHPFMAANFPAAPDWFNEGLGSLYEQSNDRGGHIVGETNWRLAGLQQAIGTGELPAFETLMKTTSHQFYEEDPGTNYAQARYLLYYLQEHDLLVRYYRQFREDHAVDPAGIETLKAVLGTDDLVTFQRKWESWVMQLRFPEAQ